MPTELRRIVFSNEELRQALNTQRIEGRLVIPFGQIQSASFMEKTRGDVLLKIYDNNADKHHEVVLGNTFVAAALMSYCIAARIPLPRNAKKSISISGDNVALDLRTEAKAGE
ncbi:MAG TPA: hypothetical protein VFA50_06330 [Stellaceae bacterium]|nr:hypothetical protein [Stellaceae bacterium]